MTAIGIIKLKRESWIVKRIKIIEQKIDLENQGKEIEALALGLVIDSIQETISDFTEMIESIKNITAYEESCINLIKNQYKN